MRSVHRVLLFIFVSQLAACIDMAGENVVLTPLNFAVTSRGTPFYGKGGIHAPGPISQLCVGFLAVATVTPGLSGNSALVQVPKRIPAELTAVLIDSDSQRVVLPFVGIQKTDHGKSACFEKILPRDTHRGYYRGELSSNDTVVVYGIHWASGKRVRSLQAPADNR